MYNIKLILFLLVVSVSCAGSPCPYGHQKIFVSQSLGDDNNDGSSELVPVKTLYRAKEIALASSAPGLCILLRGGDVFDECTSMTNQILTDYDPYRNLFAFVWDIEKPLLFSTYGPDEMATLYSGKYTFQAGPQSAIAIAQPAYQDDGDIIIENIHFKRWQIGAIFTYVSKNVYILNNVVEEIGTLYFPDETTQMYEDGQWIDLYAAGAIYPKNSKQITIVGNLVKNIHNQYEYLDKLHAFYLTRTKDSEIANNVIINASGAPLKFRRERNHNFLVENNEFYYTGPAEDTGVDQLGWVRYSGDLQDGCPYDIFIRNNKFYYPFCWKLFSQSPGATAVKCSVSNPWVCGFTACEDNIEWTDNDFRYEWQDDRSLCYTANLNANDPVNFEDYLLLARDWSKSGSYLTGDINRDDTVDCWDLAIIAYSWLTADDDGGSGIVAWYKFDEKAGVNASDSSGNGNSATVNKETAWSTDGYKQGCLNYDGTVYVLTPAENIFSQIDGEITISIWVLGDSEHLPATFTRAFYGAGQVLPGQPDRKISAIIPETNGSVTWQAGLKDGDTDSLTWHGSAPEDWQAQWNHYAFAKDANEGLMKIYHNGELVAQTANKFQSMAGIKYFAIGSHYSGSGAEYFGKMDDFRVYNRVLTAIEIRNLARLRSCPYLKFTSP